MAGVPGAVVLLSATIAPPPGIGALALYDPAERLRHYLDAVDLYLGIARDGDRVIFAENSGSDLGPLIELSERKQAANRFEPIRVPPSPTPVPRATGEARIVRYAMDNSPTLRELAPRQQVWKITGRYLVRNLRRLIDTAPDADLYINLRRWPRLWCDTSAYAFTRSGFERYLVPWSKIVDATTGAGRFGELTIAQQLLPLLERGEPRIAPRFKYEPRLDGVRGSDLQSYGSPKQQVKYAVRVVARRLAPRLWI